MANSVTVCMLRLTGTGKTSLIEALLCGYSPMNPPISTYGIIERDVEINKKNYILDVPGMLFDSDEWQIAIAKSDAVIIMFEPTRLSLMYNHVQTQFAPMVLKRKIPGAN